MRISRSAAMQGAACVGGGDVNSEGHRTAPVLGERIDVPRHQGLEQRFPENADVVGVIDAMHVSVSGVFHDDTPAGCAHNP